MHPLLKGGQAFGLVFPSLLLVLVSIQAGTSMDAYYVTMLSAVQAAFVLLFVFFNRDGIWAEN